MSRLKDLYKQKIDELKKELNLSNQLAVPRLTKVVINVGVGRALENEKYLSDIIENLRLIFGQQPIKTLAKKAIAGFKIKKNSVVGLKVTLRGERMYEFLDRLINAALPRVRDFKGISRNSFVKGEYNLGIREHIIFPEAFYENIDQVFGLQITISTTAKDSKGALLLLEKLGFPFEKERK